MFMFQSMDFKTHLYIVDIVILDNVGTCLTFHQVHLGSHKVDESKVSDFQNLSNMSCVSLLGLEPHWISWMCCQTIFLKQNCFNIIQAKTPSQNVLELSENPQSRSAPGCQLSAVDCKKTEAEMGVRGQRGRAMKQVNLL